MNSFGVSPRTWIQNCQHTKVNYIVVVVWGDIIGDKSMGVLPLVRLPTTNISQRTEKYALMVAIPATWYPQKTPDTFAYLATIIRAERNYEAGRWVAYNRQFQRETLARKDLNW